MEEETKRAVTVLAVIVLVGYLGAFIEPYFSELSMVLFGGSLIIGIPLAIIVLGMLFAEIVVR